MSTQTVIPAGVRHHQIDGMVTEASATLTRAEMEQRRFVAAEHFAMGWRQSRVAEKLGVSRNAVAEWHEKWVQAGYSTSALRLRKAPGRPRRLSEAQEAQLATTLQDHQPAPYTHEVADAIFTMFGVHYDADHVGRIMIRLGIPRRKCGGWPREPKTKQLMQ